MNDQHYALYYPTIEFQNPEWLYSAALLWDRIYRIVPSSYAPEDSEDVRALIDTGEIGIPIYPDTYAESIAEEFITKLRERKWDAAALTYNIDEEYSKLHKEKVDVKLRELIVANGSAKNADDWLHVPVEFGAHYMTYLANAIAERNNLSILTDCSPAWTGSTYFKYDGGIEDCPREELMHALATIVIRDFIPSNISTIPPKEIIKYRNEYQDERKHFMSAMKSAAERISGCDDPRVVKDLLNDIKKDVDSALTEYRRSLKVLNIVGLAGLQSVSLPVLTKIASVVTGTELSPTTLVVVSAVGLAFGLVSGFSEWKDKRIRLSKDSDYSYLIHLERNWKKCAKYDNDYNYFLCREMEEFIND